MQWSEEEYGEKLKIGGGKERMAQPPHRRTSSADIGLPDDPDGQQAMLAAWHRRKTEIYTEMVAAGGCRRGPGSRGSSTEAADAGWPLAVASTSAEASVRAVLEHAVGPTSRAAVRCVLAGDIVPKKKPAPDIYQLALRAARRRRRPTRRDRGLPQRAARGARRRASPAWSP